MKQILIEKYIKPSETLCPNGNYFFLFTNKIEQWLNDYGKLHNILGQPSEVCYYNGKVVKKEWCKNGKIHRDKGLPAVLFYNNYEEIIEMQCWRDGRFINK
jgi:hypothetical protein